MHSYKKRQKSCSLFERAGQPWNVHCISEVLERTDLPSSAAPDLIQLRDLKNDVSKFHGTVPIACFRIKCGLQASQNPMVP